MAEINSITAILDQVDQIAHDFAFQGYAALVQTIKPELTLVAIIYISLIGWGTSLGWTKFSVGQVTIHALKLASVLALASNWDVFSLYIYNVMTNGPNELSNILLNVSGNSSTGVNDAFQTVFNDGLEVASSLKNAGGITGYLSALCVFALDFFVSIIALFEMLLAKLGLAIMLVLAPVFTCLLLWHTTKSIFDSWFRITLGFALIPLFLSTVLIFITQILQMGAATINKAIASDTANIQAITSYILAAGTSIPLLLRINTIATGVASGISLSSVSFVAATTQKLDRLTGVSKNASKLYDYLNSLPGTALKSYKERRKSKPAKPESINT